MKTYLLVTATLLLTACSSGSKDPNAKPELAKEPQGKPGPSIEAKQVAAENEAAQVAEVSFAKGKAKLSPDAAKQLKETLKQAKAKGKLEAVTVLAWADQEYPSVHSEELPDEQKKLADNRAKSIRDFVQKQSRDLDVKVHSMAERPGAFQNLLSTADARLKKSLEVSGIPNSDTSIKTPSKASKAIVLFTLEEARNE